MSRRYDLVFGIVILLLGVGILIQSAQGAGGLFRVAVGILATAFGLVRLARVAGLLRRLR